MAKTLTREFEKTAAEAYEAFPGRLERLVILLVPATDMPVFVSPQVAGELTKNTGAIKEALDRLRRTMFNRGWIGLADPKHDLAGTTVSLIGLDSENIIGPFSDRYTRDMHALYVLDHEIGHHIVRNGSLTFNDLREVKEKNLPHIKAGAHENECAADAFAVLRHVQRFGINTDCVKYRTEKTAAGAVLFHDTEHYTTDTIERAFRTAKEMGDKIFTFSLHETAELAAEIAEQTRLDYERGDKIRAAYNRVNTYCKRHIGNSFEVTRKLAAQDPQVQMIVCKKTIAVMKKHQKDSDIFKAGKRLLNAPELQRFMKNCAAAEKGHFWKKAFPFINTYNPQERQTARQVPCAPRI